MLRDSSSGPLSHTLHPRKIASGDLDKRRLQTKTPERETVAFQTLNEKELQSMQSLKNAFISPPVLALPIQTGHLTFDTDAFDVEDGCVLLKEKPVMKVKPIGY